MTFLYSCILLDVDEVPRKGICSESVGAALDWSPPQRGRGNFGVELPFLLLLPSRLSSSSPPLHPRIPFSHLPLFHSLRPSSSKMAFAGQTPTIIVLKEGPSPARIPASPPLRAHCGRTTITDCWTQQARMLPRVRGRSFPTSMPALRCSPRSRARSVRMAGICCWWTATAGRPSRTMVPR